MQNPKPKTLLRRTPQEIEATRLGASLAEISQSRRRFSAIAISAACAAACLAALFIHQRSASSQYLQGSEAGSIAADSAMSVLAMRDPNVGFARLAGRKFEGSTEWGAAMRSGAIPDGSGAEVEIAFSTRPQCMAALRAAAARFELAFVDAKPASDPDFACTELGQNALRWVKLDARNDPRRARSSLSVGAYDAARGGFIPGRAAPAQAPPSSDAKPMGGSAP